uniref:11S globulin 2 n=1 Tax=Corylus avellana TaxID=13451 RepID=UPI0031F5DA9B
IDVGLRRQQQRHFGECNLDRLNALEPTNRKESEAGTVEKWDKNDQQFQCAGVALIRHFIERRGLLLPSFSNAPELIYVIKGRGFQGAVIPGCPETFESNSNRSQQGQGQNSNQSQREEQDQHQKVRQIREGDILALPAGQAHWIYNDGDSQLVNVTLLDTSNAANQLDENPRKFYLAGNPDDEHQGTGQQQFGQRRRQQQHSRGKEGEQEQQGEGTNIFSGFDQETLADSFNVDVDLARRLQSNQDKRGKIVKVEQRLQILIPERQQQEWERQERQERESEQERERQRCQGGRGRDVNGFEETICSLRLMENIANPRNADIYNPQGGRISTLNSNILPVLRYLQLSAERGTLYREAIQAPHYNLNSHSVIFAIRGNGRIQVVKDNGQNIFDGELRQGQALTIPQNFAVIKRAGSEGFEWVAFKTNDNAQRLPLAGRNSAIRAIPEDVLINSYRISRSEARRLKFIRNETTIFSSGRSSSERMRRRSESEGRAEA